jgi:hypothetical protein
MFKKIINFFKKKPKVKKYPGEYEGSFMFADLAEGGNFKNMKVVHFTPCAVTGDISPVKSRPVQFYFQLVGLSDSKAPERNWGMTHKQFLRKLGMGYYGFWNW